MERLPTAIVVRAAVSVVLLGGFYVVGIGLLAGLVWLSVWIWLVFPGQQAQEFSVMVAAFAVGLAVPVWTVFRTRPQPPQLGVPVTERQAPELWAMVRELAGAVVTRPPDEIRLTFEANAGVWDDSGFTGLRPGRRRLYLGVPLVQAFTVSQLRAVLAHELGHYSHRHTSLSAITYRGGMAMFHTITRTRGVIREVLSAYAGLYFVVALAVMRRCEVEADCAAVRLAGRGPMIEALLDTSRVAGDWDALLAGYARRARRRGYAAAELMDRFDWYLRHRAPGHYRLPRWANLPSWMRSHPPTEVRIELVAREPGPVVVPDLRPATVLVSDRDALVAAFRTDEFDRHMAVVAQDAADCAARRLGGAARRVLRSRRSRNFGDVLDLLAAGRAADLRRALGITDREAGQLADLVLASAGALLVDSGKARWRHSSGEPITLVSAEGDAPIVLGRVVTAACRRAAGVAELRTLLRDLGLAETYLTGRRASSRPLPAARPAVAGSQVDGALARMEQLLLPDELYLLAHTPKQRRRLDHDVFEAGLAAAVLAELRLRDRIALARSDDATVEVRDPTPTGDPLLDSVLARLSAGPARPAYRWLQDLGPRAADAVRRRLDQWGMSGEVGGPCARLRTRNYLTHALTSGEYEGRVAAMGSLLWGTEMVAPVLGRRSLVTRFWLGRTAARDRLALAIRIVIGLAVKTDGGGGGGGAS